MANLVQGRPENGQWPRNTLHLPSDLCDEEFAKELTGEKLVDAEEEARASITRRARRMIKPKAGKKWMKIIGRKNDWFDTTVYAFALAWHLENKRRLTLDRWADLVRELHGDSDEPGDLFEAADLNPFGKQKAASVPSATRQPCACLSFSCARRRDRARQGYRCGRCHPYYGPRREPE